MFDKFICKAHIALVHDISNVWTKLAESNMFRRGSDILLTAVQTLFCSARERHAPEKFLVACRCFSIGNFSAKQWLQRLLRAFSLAQQRCREMLWSYKRIARRDSATPITAPSTIFLDPSAAAYSWSPSFSNSDRKDRQLNPKRKAAILIAW